MTTEKNYAKLRELVDSMEGDVNKFNAKGAKASARRIRGLLMEIKKLTASFRKDIQEEVNS